MEGWVCPSCQRVYAPFVTECAACNHAATKGSQQVYPRPGGCPGCGGDRSQPALTGCPPGAHDGTHCIATPGGGSTTSAPCAFTYTAASWTGWPPALLARIDG
jgi:hypothetical protein